MNIFAMISKLLKVKFMSKIIKPINALSISIDQLWFKIVKGIDCIKSKVLRKCLSLSNFNLEYSLTQHSCMYEINNFGT